MRNLQKTLAFFGILVTGTIGQLAGCANDAQNCELNYEACPSSSGSSSGVIPPPPGCTDSPSTNAEVIRTDCAYFVGGPKANESNTGGEADPFASLATAVNAAKTARARVYVCGSVSDRVDIPAGVSVFGGFDCTGDEWQYDASQRATIAPAAPAADAVFQASVRITGNGTTNIEDVNIEAAAATIDGGSSIAVIVDKATVNFIRSNLTAGNGKDGLAGESPPDDSMLAGASGNPGKEICTAGATNPGGDSAVKMCPDGASSTGGKGGDGGLIDVVNMNKELAGGDGADGMPALGAGAKGLGEPETGTWSCANEGAAQSGQQGSRGTHGNGGQGNGDINATGYVPVNGASGSAGTPGQGGGGGGGAKGKANICGSTRAGASGGSGGSGGCGGKGGGGGQGGGASIALLALNATITANDCVITAGSGGNGGNGGAGQTGGTGASGGPGGNKSGSSNSGCSGANGGDGGNGGPGGGGVGGLAAGVAYRGNAPNVAASSTINKGTAGSGGVGGENNIDNNSGASGMSENLLPF